MSAWVWVVLGLVAAERVAELVVSRRHVARALAEGGTQHAQGHYPAMVVLHTGLLVGVALEVVLLDRRAGAATAAVATAAVVVAMGLRWWCIRVLGNRWATTIVTVPGAPLVDRGPYRWLRHPNYVAVALEGLALPLVGGAWLTAAVFTLANAVLLVRWRIPAEERALGLP